MYSTVLYAIEALNLNKQMEKQKLKPISLYMEKIGGIFYGQWIMNVKMKQWLTDHARDSLKQTFFLRRQHKIVMKSYSQLDVLKKKKR